MKLIITEKPSVARDFARALNIPAQNANKGYFQSKDYIITWAIGHLLTLATPDQYSPELKKWSINTLPFIPPVFKLSPVPATKKQLNTIAEIIKNQKISQIIIATDAGREGELIAREILQFAGALKKNIPIMRFWTSEALTPEVIRKNLNNLKPASEYDRLYLAADARSKADWIVGINLSRATTCTLGENQTLFSIGRVQTATLAILVERKKEIDNFKPTPYWLIYATFSNQKGQWKGLWTKNNQSRITDQKTAQTIASQCTNQTATVTSIKQQQKKQQPPLLFSLTTLQKEANRLYSLTAQQTLDIAQKLYETYKVISYPRTDSQHLATSNIDLVKSLISTFKKHYPHLTKHIDPKRISTSNKNVFNDAKLTDHHALIPLAPLPEGTSQNEQRIYNLILKRFIAAFCPDYIYLSTTITTQIKNHTFITHGQTPVQKGWKEVYSFSSQQNSSQKKNSIEEEEKENQQLPQLSRGEQASTLKVEVQEKLTEPPPNYTDATLLHAMTNPDRYLKDPSLKEVFKGEIGLGTQATRAQIIETLIKRAYAERKGKNIIATQKGEFLIDTLRKFKITSTITNPDETAKWEMMLENIAQGKQQPQEFMKKIVEFTRQAVKELIESQKKGTRYTPEPIGKCPFCQGDVVEKPRSYTCSNCNFVIWKQIAGKSISKTTAKQLLQNRSTSTLKGFKSRKGKTFSAKLTIDQNKKQVALAF